MRNSPALSIRLYFPVYCWRPNWYCTSQLIPRYYPTRHILCSCPLPLRSIYGGRICHYSRVRSLIPTSLRLHTPQHMIKNPLWSYVCWGKHNILPTTLPRAGRHATAILGLPGCLHPMKHGVFSRLSNFSHRRNYVPIYPMRSICLQARSAVS